MDKILAQLDGLIDRYDELTEMMADPEVIADTKRYLEVSKESASMTDIVSKYKRYREVIKEIAENDQMMRESDDKELADLAKEELADLTVERDQLEDEIKLMMVPKDPNDDKNIIMEIRGAAGGDEASLFAADLLDMYHHYAEREGWHF